MSTAPNIDTTSLAGRDEQALPPMLRQYLEYKDAYHDCYIFFQVGDFYELFFQDAIEVSRLLSLTLTSRDKNAPNPVPMCGVPVSVIDAHIERLLENGSSAAIVSQRPLKNAGKGAVERFLERIVTPGIRILGNINNDSEESLVAAVSLANESDSDISIAYCDVRKGTVLVRDQLNFPALLNELGALSPSEVILPQAISDRKIDRRLRWVTEIESILKHGRCKFRHLQRTIPKSLGTRDISAVTGYSQLAESAKRAVHLLLAYVDETTVGAELPVRSVALRKQEDAMVLDAAARKNLDIIRNAYSGSVDGTLFGLVNRTVTAGGARLLREWLLSPLVNVVSIKARHASVRSLIGSPEERRRLRETMQYVADLERIVTRIELQVVLPRELAALRDSLSKLVSLRTELQKIVGNMKSAPDLLSELGNRLKISVELINELERSLADSPEYSINQGGIIKDGFHPELDRLRSINRSGRSWMKEFEAQERRATGISSLKVKYNGVLGFFLEVTSANVSKVPAHYIRRQTTANTDRFTTAELKDREHEVLSAEGKQWVLERELFELLRARILQFSDEIRCVAASLSCLDALTAFAQLSDEESYVEPEVNDSFSLRINDGRHPMLSAALKSQFVANPLNLGEENGFTAVLTGPNMGGKSTYLRQAALITILAQSGCFVPARSASIGVCDRIFARMGASDNQSEGESTFMVEMREASYILSNATDRSLILIDEIGRGTATADGLALARAILEYICQCIKCRTLFATHFHELTKLVEDLPGVKNLCVASHDTGGNVVFTHEIKDGPADRSYGLEVAELAGLPGMVLERASKLLLLAEKERLSENGPSTQQLSMFTAVSPDHGPKQRTTVNDIRRMREAQQLRDQISQLRIDNMTPLEALNVLSGLVEQVSKSDIDAES